MSRIIKFISQAAVRDGQSFLVRCACDALLLLEAGDIAVTCETCQREIVPRVVPDTESVNVRNESGEWESFPVQQYSGPRSPWTPRVGDIVGSGRSVHRWRIEAIDGGQALIRLLGNNKNTGVPIDMNCREKVALSSLRYTPD
jgi:hypothetical protein